jgi:hypothetical protein
MFKYQKILYNFKLLPDLTDVEEQIDSSDLTDPFIQKQFFFLLDIFTGEKKNVRKKMRITLSVCFSMLLINQTQCSIGMVEGILVD